MSLYPGRRYVGDTIRLAVNWQTEDGVDIDPSEDVTLSVRSPSGVTTSYTYASSAVTRESSGDYFMEISPNESGRWFWRWVATGTGTNRALEGSFIVQTSMFFDDPPTDYGRG